MCRSRRRSNNSIGSRNKSRNNISITHIRSRSKNDIRTRRRSRNKISEINIRSRSMSNISISNSREKTVDLVEQYYL